MDEEVLKDGGEGGPDGEQTLKAAMPGQSGGNQNSLNTVLP